LEKNGIRATLAANAVAMDGALKVGQFDLILPDVIMPGEDGLSVCRRLRVQGRMPILLLTSIGAETNRIVGLEVGADDDLPKPFNPSNLLARIKATLRRSERVKVPGGTLAGRRLAFNRWVLDTGRPTLTDADCAQVPFTTAEFRPLTEFLERPRFVPSRNHLLDMTLGKAAQVVDRTTDNQISRSRRKIEADPGKPTLIATVWDGGYSLAADVRALP